MVQSEVIQRRAAGPFSHTACRLAAGVERLMALRRTTYEKGAKKPDRDGDAKGLGGVEIDHKFWTGKSASAAAAKTASRSRSEVPRLSLRYRSRCLPD